MILLLCTGTVAINAQLKKSIQSIFFTFPFPNAQYRKQSIPFSLEALEAKDIRSWIRNIYSLHFTK